MRNRNNSSFVGDQVLQRELTLGGDDLRPAGTAVTLLNIAQLVGDNLQHALFLRENVQEVLDRGDERIVLALDRVALQPGQLIQAQLENGDDLALVERVAAVDELRFIANENAELLD